MIEKILLIQENNKWQVIVEYYKRIGCVNLFISLQEALKFIEWCNSEELQHCNDTEVQKESDQKKEQEQSNDDEEEWVYKHIPGKKIGSCLMVDKNKIDEIERRLDVIGNAMATSLNKVCNLWDYYDILNDDRMGHEARLKAIEDDLTTLQEDRMGILDNSINFICDRIELKFKEIEERLKALEPKLTATHTVGYVQILQNTEENLHKPCSECRKFMASCAGRYLPSMVCSEFLQR